MFAYCGNNPVMLFDQYGDEPETWQWVTSGIMFIAGVVMTATGVGGFVGGALICAGVNSIIGSYSTEAAGGSSTAGWFGGAITGFICGAGAGMAGTYLSNAVASVGVKCIANVITAYGTSTVLGYVGSCLGQYASAAIDRQKIDKKQFFMVAVVTGQLNFFAAVGAGMGNAIKALPEFTTTSTAVATSLYTGFSLVAEGVCDAISVIVSLLG